MKHPHPAALILTPDAEEYLPYLQDLAERGVVLSIAETADAARNVYSGQPVVLGQPDLVAVVLSELPGVRWVQSSWAGVTPLLELGRSNYVLTGVKDTFGPQMAEYVFAYLLANELKIFERFEQQADNTWWQQASGSLSGKTLGIMGTGSIGRHIAQTALAFGMRVAGFNRSGTSAEGFEKMFARHQLADFLAAPDYIVCVLPDTPATNHLFDASAFSAMKNHCCLVNVGRGNVIDEKALVEALSEGELSTAVLDVFQNEPLPKDSPLWNVPGLVITAHIAARSEPRDIAGIFRENYRRYVAGEPLNYRIDFERGY